MAEQAPQVAPLGAGDFSEGTPGAAKRRGRPPKAKTVLQADHSGTLQTGLEVNLEGDEPAQEVCKLAKKGKGTKKDARGNHHATKDNGSVNIRRCGQCKKEHKVPQEMGHGQACCKQCCKRERKYREKCIDQLGQEWWDRTKQQDIETMDAMRKIFEDKMKRSERDGAKFTFSCKEALKIIESRKDSGISQNAKLMVESEWMEWAKSAKGNFCAQQRAQELWDGWVADTNHPQDNDGLNGAKRCANPYFEKMITHWEGISEINRIQQSGKIKMKDDELASKAAAFLGGFGNAGIGVDVNKMMANVASAAGESNMPIENGINSKASSALSALALGTATELLEQAKEEKKKKKKKRNGGKDSDDSDHDSSDDSDKDSHGKDQGHQKRFDPKVDCNALKRQFESKAKALQHALQAVGKEATIVLNESRSSPFKDGLVSEMATLHGRLCALDAVLSEDRDVLKRYLDSQQRVDSAADEVAKQAGSKEHKSIEEKSDSRNLDALLSAGPCVGWKDLISIHEYKLSANTVELTKKSDADEFWSKVSGPKQLFEELKRSTSTAAFDCKNARAAHHRDAVQAAKAAEKASKAKSNATSGAAGAKPGAEPKQKKSRVVSDALCGYEAGEQDEAKFKVLTISLEESAKLEASAFEHPFKVTGLALKDLLDADHDDKVELEFKADLGRMTKIWETDSARCTEGRCKCNFKSTRVVDGLQRFLKRRFPQMEFLDQVYTSEMKSKAPDVHHIFRPGVFFEVPNFFDKGKFEVGNQGVFRFIFKGARRVSSLDACQVQGYLRKHLRVRDQQSIQRILSAHVLHFIDTKDSLTISKMIEEIGSAAFRMALHCEGELLWTPQHHVTGEKVVPSLGSSDTDLIGIRLPVCVKAQTPELVEVMTELRSEAAAASASTVFYDSFLRIIEPIAATVPPKPLSQSGRSGADPNGDGDEEDKEATEMAALASQFERDSDDDLDADLLPDQPDKTAVGKAGNESTLEAAAPKLLALENGNLAIEMAERFGQQERPSPNEGQQELPGPSSPSSQLSPGPSSPSSDAKIGPEESDAQVTGVTGGGNGEQTDKHSHEQGDDFRSPLKKPRADSSVTHSELGRAATDLDLEKQEGIATPPMGLDGSDKRLEAEASIEQQLAAQPPGEPKIDCPAPPAPEAPSGNPQRQQGSTGQQPDSDERKGSDTATKAPPTVRPQLKVNLRTSPVAPQTVPLPWQPPAPAGHWGGGFSAAPVQPQASLHRSLSGFSQAAASHPTGYRNPAWFHNQNGGWQQNVAEAAWPQNWGNSHEGHGNGAGGRGQAWPKQWSRTP